MPACNILATDYSHTDNSSKAEMLSRIDRSQLSTTNYKDTFDNI